MKSIKELEQGCGTDFLISCDGISIRVLCGKENSYDLGKTIINNGIVYCQTCNEVLYRVGDVLENISNFLGNYELEFDIKSDDQVKLVLETLKSKIEGK